jgi:hypothetical protein
MNQNILFSLNDVKSRRIIKSVGCKSQINDNNWHKIHLIKRSRGQVLLDNKYDYFIL